MQRDLGLTNLFISHDLAIVRHVCERVAVMHLGWIVEIGTRSQVYDNSRHPYTSALLSAAPVSDPAHLHERGCVQLTGKVPSRWSPSGFTFRTRCPHAAEHCVIEKPELAARGTDHLVACHFAAELPSAGL